MNEQTTPVLQHEALRSEAAQLETLRKAIEEPHRPLFLTRPSPLAAISVSFEPVPGESPVGILPGLYPENLGDASMAQVHRTRFPYVCGEMANGIATIDMTVAAARAGLLGFFGAAGLDPDRIERSMVELKSRCGDLPWGTNLIHSPNEPELEEHTVDVYLKHAVRRVSASAFMALRPSIVRYAYRGIRTAPDGGILRPNHVFAKISRPEVARQFLSPAPEAMLAGLVQKGLLTADEARLARALPVAEDITVEADSGGHTDNRPLVVLLPTILTLRDELQAKFRYTRPIRVGAAGGLGTPGSLAAAFAMGAGYVLTGSVNQCTRESGQSPFGQKLLAQAGLADVTMAPAGDMFEMGVRVQVLKRGSFFPLRAAKLYELYTRYEGIENLPPDVIASLEKDIFKQPLRQTWEDTRRYFLARKPEEVERAERDPKHLMALVFRWYLGHSSRWSLQGETSRQVDYQIWCGPVMGAFNQWVAGSFMEDPAKRTVGEIALNLMHGAASVTRAHQIRSLGVVVPSNLFHYAPRGFADRIPADRIQ